MQDRPAATAPEPAGKSLGRPGALHTVLTAPFTRRAWAEAAYCLLSFPVALVGFVLVLVLLANGLALTASLFGALLGLALRGPASSGRGRTCCSGTCADGGDRRRTATNETRK